MISRCLDPKMQRLSLGMSISASIGPPGTACHHGEVRGPHQAKGPRLEGGEGKESYNIAVSLHGKSETPWQQGTPAKQCLQDCLCSC